MFKKSKPYIGLALLLFALIGFITTASISPLRQSSLQEVDPETFIQPTLTQNPTSSPTPEPTRTPVLTIIEELTQEPTLTLQSIATTIWTPDPRTSTVAASLNPYVGVAPYVASLTSSFLIGIGNFDPFEPVLIRIICECDGENILVEHVLESMNESGSQTISWKSLSNYPIGNYYVEAIGETSARITRGLFVITSEYLTETVSASQVPLDTSTSPFETATATLPNVMSSGPTRSPTNTPVSVSLERALIEAEYPEKIEIGRSDWVRFTLIRTEQQTWVATVESTEHVAVVVTPQAVGTREAPLPMAFGTEYTTGCATAVLKGQAFNISDVTSGCQDLAQYKITWEWNIIPKSDALGPQVINIRLEGQWENTATGATVQRELYSGRLEVEVTRPITGYINTASLVSGFFGSGLSIPWLFDKLKDLRDKRKKKEDDSEGDKPKIVLP